MNAWWKLAGTLRPKKMKTGHHTDIERTFLERNAATRKVDHSCSARKMCVRCSMIKIVQHRFKVFRQAFGRDPLPHEPLFFAENLRSPRIADRDQMIRQLAHAADAMTVPLPPLLRFLGLE